MIVAKRITKENADEEELEKWNHCFPSNQDPNCLVVLDSFNYKTIDFFGYYDNGTFVGATLSAKIGLHSYFIYWIAVLPEFQSKGYGSKIMKFLLKKYKKRNVILFFENPDQEFKNKRERKQRVKRYNFYKRLGLFILKDTDITIENDYTEFWAASSKKIDKPSIIKMNLKAQSKLLKTYNS